jgi:TolB-like protein/DNA-binding winged helix-turn-helix (wHTH) protein
MSSVGTRYSFDGWTVDVDSGELRRGPVCTRLQERPLRLLQVLLEAQGEVVTRETLIGRLWPTGVVEFEMGLNAAVRRLRSALEDDADAPKYIETLPRKGYRFIFPLARAPSLAPAPSLVDSPPSVNRSSPRRRILWVAGVAALAAVGVGIWYAGTRGSARREVDLSIAVLPFVDLGDSSNQDYLADGATEDISATLGKMPGLRVIGHSSAFFFKGRTDDLRSIGRQLGATYLVEGSVRRSGAHLRLTADLVEAGSGRRLWSDAYDRDYGDLLDTQLQVATSIARSLQLAVNTDVTRNLRNAHNMEAYTLYLNGRAAIDRGDATTLEAKTYFSQALASDPLFVQAAEALALAHLEEVAGQLSPADVAWPGGVEAARKALQLDPHSMLSHAVLGLEYATYEYNWPAAGHELDVILAANSRDPDVLYIASWLAFDLGRHDEALRLQDAALALDPLNPDSLQNSAYIHFLIKDYARAEADFRRSSAVSPTFGANHRMLGRILLEQGQPQAALKEMMAEARPALGLVFAYHALGRDADSDRALAEMLKDYHSVGAVNVAKAYAYRGENDRAFEWLNRAVLEHDLNLGHDLKYDPTFAGLRSEPRYHEVLRSVHLEP